MATALNLPQQWLRLRWEWQRQRARHPWMAVMLAALLLAAAALIGFSAWQERLDDTGPVIVEAVPKAKPLLLPEAQARADLAHFYGSLPPAHGLSAPAMALLRLGDKHGLHFSQGEYHTLAEPNSPLVREEIILPVEASPADIEAFLHDALQSLRSLTLTGISFERDNVNMTLVKARIHLVLLARAS
jgi:hypothetical protein